MKGLEFFDPFHDDWPYWTQPFIASDHNTMGRHAQPDPERPLRCDIEVP